MLAEFEEMMMRANNEISQLPSGSLSVVMRGEKKTFFQVEKIQGKRVRKSINRNADKIHELARKRYLETKIEMLNKNMGAMKLFCREYEEVSFENILQKIPKSIHKECISKPKDDWSAQPYQQSTYLPEKKIHTTSGGIKVRSKSEILIAEKFHQYEIPFRYEQVLKINEIEFAPDFTILAKDNSLIYWEHCGLTNDSKYLNYHKWKLSIYEDCGIVPWKNLIVTYDDEFGNINMSIVESEIKNRILRTV
jgi:hypothetical protein